MTTEMIIVLALLVVAGSGIALANIYAGRRRHEQLVKRMRTSEMYGHLYPLLKRCERRFVEWVSIRTDEVSIRMYRPAGRTLCYTFEKHGFDNLAPDMLYALAQAISVDMRTLRDTECYNFRAVTETLENGEKRRRYEYIIRNEYKDQMLRAAYSRQDET